MGKGRLEAFSDGVLAIIITIMVLEIKVPHSSDLAALKPLLPILFSYVLSFVNVAIYWNNHHHLLHTVKHVNGNILWANSHLLFWLSLFPAATSWMGENHFAKWPVVIYGGVLIMAGIAYTLLQLSLKQLQNENSVLVHALEKDRKGLFSVLAYALGIMISFVNPLIGVSLYTLVTMMWFIPSRRIEKLLADEAALTR